LSLVNELQFFELSPSKFTVSKIGSRENFGKFMRFVLKCMSPFKIQTCFKLDLFLDFIIENPERFGS
jgi:hypothetical protein